MKKCPYCAEEIQDEAVVCRFCDRQVSVIEPSPKKQMPAIGWGILVGLVIALLTITRRGDSVADALYLMQYPPFDQIGKQIISSLVLGSVMNLIVWALITTGVILLVRAIFKDQSEARVLLYSFVILVTLLLGMAYYYGVTTLSSFAQADISMERTPTLPEESTMIPTSIPPTKIYPTSTSRPKIKTYFPDPMLGAFESQYDRTDDYSRLTAEGLGEFFGVGIVDAYEFFSDTQLVPFEEFSAHYIRVMNDAGFELEKKGGNYLIFKHTLRDTYIGMIHHKTSKTYHFAQW